MNLRASALPLYALVASAFAFTACSDDTASTPANSHDAGSDAAPVVDAAAEVDAGPAGDAAPVVRFATRVVVRALSAAGHDRLYNVVVDPQGRSVAVGQLCPTTVATDDCVSVVTRMLPDGNLDTSFGNAGVATVNFVVGGNGEVARGLVLTAEGKIVIAAVGEQVGASDARERDVYLARFLDDGRLDSSFGVAGVAALDLAPGKLVGTVFKTDSQWGLAQDASGRLYVSGSCVGAGRDDTDFAVARLSANGTRDAAFATAGLFTLDVARFDGTPKELLVDASGRVVMGGYYTDPASTVVSPIVFRLTDSGALDSTYGTAGHRLVDLAAGRDTARTLKVLPSGAVLMVGSGRRTSADQDGMFSLLSRDGAPVAEFGANGARAVDLGGAADALWGLAVSGDRAVAVGVVAGGVAGADAAVPDDDSAIVFLDLR